MKKHLITAALGGGVGGLLDILYAVLPLSAIGPRPMTLVGAIRGLLPHIIFVGPAIAVFTARRAKLPG